MKFCDKLQKIRRENNITQEELADKLSVSRQAVSKWESGTAYPDTEKLIQISKIFKISLDELVNDNVDVNKGTNKKKFNFMEIFDLVFETVKKIFSMFFAMKFWEKVKFLIEMGFVALAIYLTAALVNSIILSIIRRIFGFLPYGVFNVIDYVVYTLLYIIWLILGAMFFFKILKTRYLDYYVVIEDDSVQTAVVEEPIKELKERKECKVVIRDPEHSSFNVFKKLWGIILFFIKIFAVFIAMPVVFFFVFLVVMLVMSLFYLFNGLLFNGITVSILGLMVFTYLLIRFIYNLVFNLKTNYGRIFIVFIASLVLMGAGVGMAFTGFNRIEIVEDEVAVRETEKYTIKMSDDLVIDGLNLIDDDKFIIDNNLDNIDFDVVRPNNAKVDSYSYRRYDEDGHEYRIVGITISYNGLKAYRDILDDLKDKKISLYNYYYDSYHNYEIDKVYISETNLTKIRENYHNIQDYSN